jgi:hypothetical protein
MKEVVTFPDINSFDPLAVKFTSLWYLSNMGTKWKSNTVLHTYYLKLKRDIESFPRITSKIMHRFRTFFKFHVDRHFIYITVREDEHKEVLQSYYKLTEEYLEEITKECPTELLIPVDPTKLSDPKLIEIPMVTCEGNDTPGTNKRKKTEQVQQLSSASEETASESPGVGGDDKVDKEENNGKEY